MQSSKSENECPVSDRNSDRHRLEHEPRERKPGRVMQMRPRRASTWVIQQQNNSSMRKERILRVLSGHVPAMPDQVGPLDRAEDMEEYSTTKYSVSLRLSHGFSYFL